MSIADNPEEKLVSLQLTGSELRYLVAAGYGLLQNIPADSLPTYTNFTADEIKSFSKKIRTLMDDNDISI
jgi:hypothetical protein